MPQEIKDNIITDKELISIIRDKNEERYGEITERYRGKLFAYLYRLVGQKEEAEDLLQDVFLKAFRNLKSYDNRRKFSSWIYRIAHNEAINHIKRKSLKKFITWENITLTKDKITAAHAGEAVDDAWIRKEKNQELEDALDKLPLKYKQVLIFRYYSDQSYEEMSEILDKPINTIGTLINRAKKRLILQLAKDNKARMGKRSARGGLPLLADKPRAGAKIRGGKK